MLHDPLSIPTDNTVVPFARGEPEMSHDFYITMNVCSTSRDSPHLYIYEYNEITSQQ